METQDGNGSSRGVGDQTKLIEVRLAEFCEHCLSLDEKIVEQAVKVLKETKHLLLTNLAVRRGGSSEEAERYWFACICLVVKRLEEKSKDDQGPGSNETGLILNQIVRLAKLNMKEFLKELTRFIVKAGLILNTLYDADWENYLEVVSYDRVYKEFFLTHDANEKQPRAASQGVHTLDYHCFGWLLILGLGIHAISRKDSAILILHMPVRFRNFSLIDSQLFVKRGDKGIDVLASLCNKYDASEEEVKKTMDMINNLIASILKKKPKPAAECNRENLLDCLVYFEDIMDESSFESSLCAFNDSICGSKSLSGVGVNTADTMRNLDMAMTPKKTITSPPSPYQFPMHPTNGVAGSICKITSTPGTFAMTTSKWLQTTISPHLSGPSARLELFLASCDKDVTNDVTSWPLGEHRATGSSQSTNLMDNIWAEQRRKDALKLYYRVLEAMCVAKSQILHATNLKFLNCDRFHRCMLTCSAELVLVTRTRVSRLFPAVLERTGITAFDLVKGIESFIGHEESLPTELLRYMNSLEERLLESTAWERGSSMYNALTVARPSLSAEIHRLALLAEPMPSLDAIVAHNYSVEYVDNAPGNFIVSPTRPNPVEVGQTYAETAIGVFFKKINKVAAVRINGVIERLQPSQQHIRENTYRLFQQVLNHQTSLFFNRHVGQIILCCLYGIAKISKVNLTFKEIIDNYRKETHYGPQELRRVFVDLSLANHSSGYTDIIVFYNEVFVPAAKPLLVEVGPAVISTVSEVTNNKDGILFDECFFPNSGCGSFFDAVTSLFPRVPDMSPRKVSAERNIYVSPLRTSTIDALISPGSKSYYACIEESTRALQSPSKDLADVSKRLNRKIRGDLNFNGPVVGLVSDSMVVSSLNLQNGSSGSSSGTSMTSEHPDS
ncbi:Retinoblastoma-related protein 1 [Orobanche minor]